MAYKKYCEQIYAHIIFLRSKGFDVIELKVNTDFIRCHQADKHQYRGEFAYKTRTIKLNNGLTGVQTWYRGPKGECSSFQTYGLGPSINEEAMQFETIVEVKPSRDTAKHNEAGRKAYGFWQYSTASGRSEYLERKKVGYYGIRFRSNAEYGDVAVIPMVDELGRLWNYQLLNSDGTKRHPKDARTEGIFHMIGNPINGNAVGIAESYVTSASCFELTGIPTACAFSCQNLKNIAVILKQLYARSKLIIFADNDRHLEERGGINQGLIKAQNACKLLNEVAIVVVPDFGNAAASKSLNDWNDLINQNGFEYAREQIMGQLQKKSIQKEK